MKTSPAYLFIFSLLPIGFLANAQEVEKDSMSNPEHSDTLMVRDVAYAYGIFVGAEYGKWIESAFQKDKRQYEGFVKVRLYRRWHVVAAYGSEAFFFDDSNGGGWHIQINGTYVRAGFDYAIFQARYSTDDNVYAGLRYGTSRFDQIIKRYIIRTKGGAYDQTGHLPKARVQTDWIGIVIGAQVEVIHTGLYVGIELNPRFKLSETQQDGIKNLYTPGFGEDINGRSFDYQATISYKIPLFKRRVKERFKAKT